jgi:F-type H+-transporting ATPase subunit gamma
MLIRRKKDVVAEFSNLPPNPGFIDVSQIGNLIINEYENQGVDQVFLVYTRFINMMKQEPVITRLLPLEVEPSPAGSQNHSVFSYEPDGREILDTIIRRFTAIQVYQAILSSLASEHAARMVAMRNATDSAKELITGLQMEYNKARQQSITNDIIDIVGGVEALAKSRPTD